MLAKGKLFLYNVGVKVAFIGHRNFEKTKELKEVLTGVIIKLIDEGADTFLFGSKSRFDDTCYETVTELQKTYPHIRRIDVRASNEYLHQMYIDIILKHYEETVFPERVSGAGYRSYIKRNQAMIDMCNVLVVYCDMNYKPLARTKSGTILAVKYAQKKNKQIINVINSTPQ